MTTVDGLPVSAFRRVWPFGQGQTLLAVSVIGLATIVLSTILVGWVWPSTAVSVDIANRLSPPSLAHPFGTDELGRNMVARVLHGGRTSLIVGALALIISSAVGWSLGVAGGYIGGRIDSFLQRTSDVILGMPALLLALAVITAIGRSTLNVAIALAVAFIPRILRITRAQAVATRNADFVKASELLGSSRLQILWRHIVPQTFGAYLVLATSLLGNAILLEASLSFLGLGVPPPAPSWGQLLGTAIDYFRFAPWLALAPGIILSLAVFFVTVIGDHLRDRFDPRTQS